MRENEAKKDEQKVEIKQRTNTAGLFDVCVCVCVNGTAGGGGKKQKCKACVQWLERWTTGKGERKSSNLRAMWTNKAQH